MLANIITILIKSAFDGAGVNAATAATKGLADNAESWGNQLKRGIGQQFGTIVTNGLTRAASAMGDLVTQGVRYNATMEDARDSIATGLLSTRPGSNFADMRKEADQTLVYLKQKANESAATEGDLRAAYSTNLMAMVNAGLRDSKKQIDLIAAIGDAAKVKGLDGFQVMQETRALLSGDFGPDAALANQFFSTAEAKASYKAALLAGSGIAMLTAKLKPFSVAAKEMGGNFSVMMGNIQAALEELNGQVFAPVFKEMKVAMAGFFDGMKSGDLRAQLAPIGESMAVLMRSLMAEAPRLPGLLRAMAQGFVLLAQGVAAVPWTFLIERVVKLGDAAANFGRALQGLAPMARDVGGALTSAFAPAAGLAERVFGVLPARLREMGPSILSLLDPVTGLTVAFDLLAAVAAKVAEAWPVVKAGGKAFMDEFAGSWRKFAMTLGDTLVWGISLRLQGLSKALGSILPDASKGGLSMVADVALRALSPSLYGNLKLLQGMVGALSSLGAEAGERLATRTRRAQSTYMRGSVGNALAELPARAGVGGRGVGQAVVAPAKESEYWNRMKAAEEARKAGLTQAEIDRKARAGGPLAPGNAATWRLSALLAMLRPAQSGDRLSRIGGFVGNGQQVAQKQLDQLKMAVSFLKQIAAQKTRPGTYA